MNTRTPKGLILLNLGTPEQPNAKAVGKYLREFLMDPYVVDIPFMLRWILVKLLIVPRRSHASAKLYQKIWTDRGSPLLYHLLDLVTQVRKVLGKDWVVQPAMRYGTPSIAEALKDFKAKGITDILVFPLYPQYSESATESSIQECLNQQKLVYAGDFVPELKFVKPFYAHPDFIESFSQVIQESLKDFPHDHLLFSFHGLPERHIKHLDRSGKHCLTKTDCCERVEAVNADCYRAHCYITARKIAQQLGLKSSDYTVCFQSRLGRTPWIRPFTDELYVELAKKGVKRLAVAGPSFVADCLETLEEVQMRGRDQFIESGGQDLKLVPSLNASEKWAHAVGKIVQGQQ